MVRCGRLTCERDAVEGSDWCAVHQGEGIVAADVLDKDKPLTISALVAEAHANSRAHDWWPMEEFSVPEKFCLVHSEVSKALEVYRERPGESLAVREHESFDCWACCRSEDSHGGICSTCDGEGVLYKPVGFASELADVLIRVGDLAGKLGIDLEAAVLNASSGGRRRYGVKKREKGPT